MRITHSGFKWDVDPLSVIRGEAFENEYNDCSVRALKHVCGVPYPDAHACFARLGRRPRKGITGLQMMALTELPHVYGYKVMRVILPSHVRTLGQAMMYLRTGRYLIVKTGHAIGCIDGVLYDTSASGPSSRIKMIMKFTPTSELERSL